MDDFGRPKPIEIFRMQSGVRGDVTTPRTTAASNNTTTPTAGLIDIFLCIVNQRIVLQVCVCVDVI